MKKLFSFIIAAVFAAGCSEAYDDSALTGRVDNLEDRVSKLEILCSQMNTNISSLQTLVNALSQNDYITNVAPISRNGEEVGYTITFKSGKTITIYHGEDGKDGTDGKDGINGTNGADGKDGKDGSTPIIGVKLFNGVYYWTLNGEWLLDDDGNKIKAVGTDGKDGQNGTDGENGADGEDGKDGQNGADGKDGITPQLKIEEGYWYISYDNGSSWKQLGKATGEDGKDGADGDSFFQSVTQDDEYVYFTLADGTQISILKASAISSVEISYVPRYDDGKATVVFTTAEDSSIEMDFQIMPKSAAAIIAKDWKNTLSLKAVETQTRAVEYIDMPISKCTADATNGTITITASGKNLPQTFFDAETKVRAALFYENSIGGAVSEYVELAAVNIVNRIIRYTATEKIIPFKTDVFGANIVSNEWDSATNEGVITFDANVTEIGKYALTVRTSLTSITIPDSVTEIGYLAFEGCSSLKTITIPDSVTTIGDGAFGSCRSLTSVTIGDSVTTIGDKAFSGCKSLTSITIGDSVTTIGEYAFSECLSLTSITIPDSVTTIGNYAFCYCSSLTSITIPDSVTTIGSSAFNGCNRLKSVNITDIAAWCSISFAESKIQLYCAHNLYLNGKLVTDLVIPDSVTTIGTYAFYNCSSLTSVTIPDSVTTIEGGGAFQYCSSLTNVTIGNSVTTIGNYAFKGCSSLTSVTIPDSVTTIEFHAFKGCSSLTTAVIGSGVKKIEDSAFENCIFLNEIICKPTTPPTASLYNGKWYAFDAIGTSPKIYVPMESVDAYKTAAGWKDYADIIVGYDFNE